MLSAENLSVFNGDHCAVNGLTMALEPGQFMAIIGPNGAGKSTALRCLAGVCKAQSGEIKLNDQQLKTVPINHRAKAIAYLPQHTEPSWSITVENLVALGRLPHLPWHKRLTENDQQAIEVALEKADMLAFKHRAVGTLSGGELRRVLIARLLATQAPILLADEPTAALDIYHQLQLMNILKQHCEGGGSVVIALHDLNLAANFCDSIVLLNKGEVQSIGSPRAVLTEDAMKSVYGVEAKIIADSHGINVMSKSICR